MPRSDRPLRLHTDPARRAARRPSGPLMVLGTAATFALYVVAALLLRSEPSPEGYDALLIANRLAVLTAAFAAGIQMFAAHAGAPGTRHRAIASALLAVTTAVPVAAVGLLGSQLSHMTPAAQPPAVNSMLLAMVGAGQDLAPVPAVFAAAAVLIAAGPTLRRRRPALSSPDVPGEPLVRV